MSGPFTFGPDLLFYLFFFSYNFIDEVKMGMIVSPVYIYQQMIDIKLSKRSKQSHCGQWGNAKGNMASELRHKASPLCG